MIVQNVPSAKAIDFYDYEVIKVHSNTSTDSSIAVSVTRRRKSEVLKVTGAGRFTNFI